MRLSLANDINVLAVHAQPPERTQPPLYRDFTLNDADRTPCARSSPVSRCTGPTSSHGQTPERRGPSPSSTKRDAPWPSAGTPARTPPSTTSCATSCSFKFPADMDDRALVAEHEQFVMKFQQCTGPIMAKGLEDTAFYIYNRLVGAQRGGRRAAAFRHRPGGKVPPHQRAQPPPCWPHTMLASSTHDTKRSRGHPGADCGALGTAAANGGVPCASWSSCQPRSTRRRSRVSRTAAPDANEEYPACTRSCSARGPSSVKGGGERDAAPVQIGLRAP